MRSRPIIDMSVTGSQRKGSTESPAGGSVPFRVLQYCSLGDRKGNRPIRNLCHLSPEVSCNAQLICFYVRLRSTAREELCYCIVLCCIERVAEEQSGAG